MRYFALFLMLFSLCVFSVGCTEPAATPTTPPAEQEGGETEGGETEGGETEGGEETPPAEPEESDVE